MNARAAATRIVLITLLSVVAAAGCGRPDGNSAPPWCDDYSVLILAAQSVPTAEFVPCVDVMPVGWSVNFTDVDSDGFRFTLDSRIAGDEAARIELSAACEMREHVEVPSDVDIAQRFEYLDSIESGIRGQRVYVFDGGCVSIDVDLEVEVSAALLSEISLALGFVTRDDVNEAVRSVTDDREQVDPLPPG